MAVIEIATAFVTIRPETSGFESELASALGGQSVEVPVGADVEEAQGQIEGLEGGDVEVEVGAVTDPAQAEIDGIDGGETEVKVEADTAQAQASIDDLSGSIGGLADMAGGGGGAAAGLTGELVGMTGASAGATAGIAAIVGGLGLAVSAASEAEGVQARLNAVLESTGAGAYTTAEDINALASEVMAYSGQSDESIASAATLLATFANLSTQAAITTGTFDRAVETTADIAALMGGDASGAAVKLGRALDNPTVGMTALQRSGVSFTESQKATITALQESGDILGAQGALLDVVESQVGQVAEAYGASLPGQIDRATEAFGEMAETIGGQIAPALADATGGTADYLSALTDVADAAAGFGGGALGDMQDFLVDGFVGMIPGVNLLRGLGESLGYVSAESDGAAKGISDVGSKAEGAAGGVGSLTDAVSGYVDAIFGLTGTEDDVLDAFDRLYASLLENGPALEDNSRAARENRDAFRDIVAVTGEWIDKARERGATEAEVQAIQQTGIARINETRDAFGLSTSAVEDYTSSIANLPNGHKLDVEQPGMSAAQGNAVTYRGRIYALPTRWNTTFIADTGGARASIQALIDKIAQLNSASTGNIAARIGQITAGLQRSESAPIAAAGESIGRSSTASTAPTRITLVNQLDGQVLTERVFEIDRRMAMAEGYEPA